jgi:TfoX/Sxy family transcriptional regulator of competence genes
MAFDEQLASRVRKQLSRLPGFTERRMFGGLCFLLNGHMTAGIVGANLMLRVGPEQYREALAQPHAREMDFTGRPLNGMIYVDAPGIETEQALKRWLKRGVSFVSAQPAKAKTPRRQPRPRHGKGR